MRCHTGPFSTFNVGGESFSLAKGEESFGLTKEQSNFETLLSLKELTASIIINRLLIFNKKNNNITNY